LAAALNPSESEWNAAAYHRLSNPQLSWGEKVLARLPLNGDETVVDAGCGSGRLTALLLDRLPRGQVIAVDRSQNMLRQAADYLQPRYGDQVTFIAADLLDLELASPVDAIFSTATFHWVLDHQRLFHRLHGLLRPGGRLVAQCGGGPNIAAVRARGTAMMRSPDYAPYFVGWHGPWVYADAETTAQRLRAAGFVEIETSLEPAPTRLGSAAEYEEYLATIIFRTHLQRIPDADQRRAFVHAITELAARDDPPFVLDYWRLNLQGRRPPPGP
jgi:trans-aconitate 2-methyltransferase